MAAVDHGYATDLVLAVVHLDANDGMESAVFVQIPGRKLRVGHRRCNVLPKVIFLREVVSRRTLIVGLLHATSVPQLHALGARKQPLASVRFWPDTGNLARSARIHIAT